MEAFWQTLPLRIDPIAFSIGFFSFSWYALFYFLGVSTVLFFLFRERKNIPFLFPQENFWSFVTAILWGVLIGARLGYVLLYGGREYWEEPWRIVSPYDFHLHIWTGIRGLSFFGGLIGGILGLLIFTKKHKLSFLTLSDFIVPFLPLGLFFGRLGNFFNGELFGRPTTVPWGMYFPPASFLRHPSELYEALGEGLLLFLILTFLARRKYPVGTLTAFFLVFYGMLRFSLEFFRAPDRGESFFLGSFTHNQLFSLILVCIGFFLLQKQKKSVV